MKLFVINGTGSSGKDTFVKMIGNYIDRHVFNISSVDKIKEAATLLGWTGEKTAEARLFLHELKMLTTKYNDHSFNFMVQSVKNIYKVHAHPIIFLHVREPKEIEKIVLTLGAKTVIIHTECEEWGNDADDKVYDYCYDYMIDNTGSLEDLREQAIAFCKEEGLVD